MHTTANRTLWKERLTPLKECLPLPVVGALRQLRAAADSVAFRHGRRLDHVLPSGLRVAVCDRSDWNVYNEIFVDGEYDVPIRTVLDSGRQGPCIVDLGANSGYFGLRFADMLWREMGVGAAFRLIMVEGSPRTFSQLRRQFDQPALQRYCDLHCGLAGRRSGYAYISASAHTGINSIVDRRSLRQVRVDFLDIERIVPEHTEVALLKCDIESAEELFIESYPALLCRVAAAVFEFHHRCCDVARCREMLNRAGLNRWTPLREYADCSVELFARSGPSDPPLAK
jgi:FkbM family methyltransferase